MKARAKEKRAVEKTFVIAKAYEVAPFTGIRQFKFSFKIEEEGWYQFVPIQGNCRTRAAVRIKNNVRHYFFRRQETLAFNLNAVNCFATSMYQPHGSITERFFIATSAIKKIGIVKLNKGEYVSGTALADINIISGTAFFQLLLQKIKDVGDVG